MMITSCAQNRRSNRHILGKTGDHGGEPSPKLAIMAASDCDLPGSWWFRGPTILLM
jgi:hypothetical protein